MYVVVDAERVISNGGVYVNFSRVSHPETVLLPGTHILLNNVTLLRIGMYIYIQMYHIVCFTHSRF